MNWKGREPSVSTSWPKRDSWKYSLITSLSGNVTIMPSTDSKVSTSVVEAEAGSTTGEALGRVLPLLSMVVDPAMTLSWLIPKKSPGVPIRVTRSPGASAESHTPRQNTKMPSDVAGSASASASSSWTKNPSSTSSRVNNAVTMACTSTSVVIWTVGPDPWISWMKTCSIVGGTISLGAPGVLNASPDTGLWFVTPSQLKSLRYQSAVVSVSVPSGIRLMPPGGFVFARRASSKNSSSTGLP